MYLPPPVTDGVDQYKVTCELPASEETAVGAEAVVPGIIEVLVMIVFALVPAEF